MPLNNVLRLSFDIDIVSVTGAKRGTSLGGASERCNTVYDVITICMVCQIYPYLVQGKHYLNTKNKDRINNDSTGVDINAVLQASLSSQKQTAPLQP